MTITRSIGARPAGTVAALAASSDRGPVTRVVVGSVGVGALLMFVLTVGVTAGAREYAITAMALLGAGAGPPGAPWR